MSQKITAIEWLNKGYHGHRPNLLVANEKNIKLYELKCRDHDEFRSTSYHSDLEERMVVLPKGTSSLDYLKKSNYLAFP